METDRERSVKGREDIKKMKERPNENENDRDIERRTMNDMREKTPIKRRITERAQKREHVTIK